MGGEPDDGGKEFKLSRSGRCARGWLFHAVKVVLVLYKKKVVLVAT